MAGIDAVDACFEASDWFGDGFGSSFGVTDLGAEAAEGALIVGVVGAALCESPSQLKVAALSRTNR